MTNKFITVGASNHTKEEREVNDFYATEPLAATLLMELEPNMELILEPACGMGHLSEAMIKCGKRVVSFDLIDRGYSHVANFFDVTKWNGHIVTNPPFKDADKFLEHAMKIIPIGKKICFFLKVQWLESKARGKLFKKYPPQTVYASSSRIQTAKNAEFARMKKGGGSAFAFAWFVWEKGYQGDTILRWFN